MYYLGGDIGFVDDEWMEQAAEESSRYFREYEREERKRRSRDPPKNATVKALHSLNNPRTEAARKKRLNLIRNAPSGDLKYIDSEGRTLLFTLKTDRTALCDEMQALISRKVIDINHRATDGSTALHYHCLHSPLEVTKLLIDSGANMNSKDNEGSTPPMRDISLEIAQLFAEKGLVLTPSGGRLCDLSIQDNRHFTACTCAVIREEPSIARIYALASPSFDGQALAIALHEGGKAMSTVDTLLSRKDVNLELMVAEPGYGGLQQNAQTQKLVKLIDYIGSKGDSTYQRVAQSVPEVTKAYAGMFLSSALLEAVENLSVPDVRRLLVKEYGLGEAALKSVNDAYADAEDRKKDPTATTDESVIQPQRGPLAAWSTRPPPFAGYEPDINRRPSKHDRTIVHVLLKAVHTEKSRGSNSDGKLALKNGESILRLLLAAGADPNGRNSDDIKKHQTKATNSTPLDEDSHKWFIKGDRVNPDGIAESYPIMLATSYGLLGCARIIATCRQYDRALRPADGKGPLPVAYALMCREPAIAKMLLTEVAGGSLVDGGSDDALETLGRLHEVRNEHYIMTLDEASARRYTEKLPSEYLEIARMILGKSSVVDSPIIRGSWEVNNIILANGGGGVSARGPVYRTQLMRLVWELPIEMKQRDSLKSIRLLLDHGADINAQDDDGYTALMAAANAEWREAVELLLKEGADPTLTTVDGLTVLEEIEAKCDRKYPGMKLFESMWAPKNREIIELVDPMHPLLAVLYHHDSKSRVSSASASSAAVRVCLPQEPEFLRRTPASYSTPPSRMSRFSGVLPGNCGVRHDDPEGDFDRPPYDRPAERTSIIAKLARGDLDPRSLLSNSKRGSRTNKTTARDTLKSDQSQGAQRSKKKQTRANKAGRGGRRSTGGGTIYDFGHGEVEYYSDGNDPYVEFDDESMPFGFRGRRHVSRRPDPSEPLSIYQGSWGHDNDSGEDYHDPHSEGGFWGGMDPYMAAAMLSGSMPFRGGDDDDFFALYGMAAMGIDPSSYLESMGTIGRGRENNNRRGRERGRGNGPANSRGRGQGAARGGKQSSGGGRGKY